MKDETKKPDKETLDVKADQKAKKELKKQETILKYKYIPDC